MTQQQRWGTLIAVAGLVVIAVATLRPGPVTHPGTHRPVCGDFESQALVADFILNVLLFAPLGFGGRLAGWRPRFVLVFGAGLSATVELLQLRVIPGRDASVLDVLANTIGTGLGVLLATALWSLLSPSARAASRLAICSTIGWLLLLLFGGWALQPAPSKDALWGERTPELGRTPRYAGDLRSARLYGVEMPSARLSNDDMVRREMSAGRISLDAVVRPPTRLSGSGPIVRVADACGREILAFGQSWTDLVFKMRMRATAIGLTTPSFLMPSAFANPEADASDEAGSPDSLSVRLVGGRVTLAASSGTLRSREVSLSPTQSWSMLVPWNHSLDARTELVTAIWVGALLLPMGFWSGIAWRERARRPVVLLSAAVVAAGAALVPLLFGMPPLPPSQWLAMVAGLAIGSAVGIQDWRKADAVVRQY